jgi:hypothetical protein
MIHEDACVNIYDKEQKGFVIRRAGCVEHATIVNALNNDAAQRKRSIYVLSLNLKDTFGSVPHDLIDVNMVQLGFLDNMKKMNKIFIPSYLQNML